jgi:hypothetical protein
MVEPYDEADVRRQVRTWIGGHWDPTLTVGEWWRRLVDARWAYPDWPQE